MTYFALDFETGNASPLSACALGVSIFEDGKLAGERVSLLKPPSCAGKFHWGNVRVNHIKENMAAMKIRCLCNNCAVKNIHLGTKGSESFQMLVDRTASNIASAWKRNFRSFIFAKQSTKKIV